MVVCLRWGVVLSVLGVVVYVCISDEPRVCVVCVVTSD